MILVVINSHLFTAKHRIPLIMRLKSNNYNVICAVQKNSKAEKLLISKKINTVNWSVSRKGKFIFFELISMYRLLKLYLKLKPDMVIHATIKPVIYGTIASYFAKVGNTINLITGLGSVFVKSGLIAKLFKTIIVSLYKIVFRLGHQKIIFQNDNDRFELMPKKSYKNVKIIRIAGSGVDISDFPILPFPKTIRITLIGRIIKEKGIDFFINTSKIIKKNYPNVKFTLVGPVDIGNPSFISEDYLLSLNQENEVEWWNSKNDILSVYKESSIVVLPSLREGLPKTLLEAGLCGRPVVATDVPGCRDVVINGKTGYLFPLNDKRTYIDQIEDLINNKEKMILMGKAGHEHIVNNFSTEKIIPKIILEIDKSFNKVIQ